MSGISTLFLCPETISNNDFSEYLSKFLYSSVGLLNNWLSVLENVFSSDIIAVGFAGIGIKTLVCSSSFFWFNFSGSK